MSAAEPASGGADTIVVERPSARLLVLDADGRVLLFRFDWGRSSPEAESFWATPGGALDPGESYACAACRELKEEVGLAIADPGPEIARREAMFRLPNGEMAHAEERYFLVRVGLVELSRDGWTELEREVMVEHRWFSRSELRAVGERIFPETLEDILIGAGAW